MGHFLGAVGTGAVQFSRLRIPGRNAESEYDAVSVSEQNMPLEVVAGTTEAGVGYVLVVKDEVGSDQPVINFPDIYPMFVCGRIR